MTRNQSDTAWKIILDRHLKDFFDYCLPQLSMLIDWERPPIPLDKELEAITKGNDAGMRLLDKLFEVYFKDGQEQWILLHIEVQGKPDGDFSKRMFTYAYRAFDKYQKPIISCAILTDDCKTWRPDSYEIGAGGCSLGIKFLMVKLLDYKGTEAELDASNNIFASVILTQLKALEIKLQPDMQRKQAKFLLTKRLYEKGFAKKQVVALYEFIDWSIGLPVPIEIEYSDAILELMEERKMTYVSFIEQRGIERGKAEGKAEGKVEGKLEVAKKMLEENINPSIIEKVTGFSIDKLAAIEL